MFYSIFIIFRPPVDFIVPDDENFQHLHPNHPGLTQTANFPEADISLQLGEIGIYSIRARG